MLLRISAAQLVGQWDPYPTASVAWVRGQGQMFLAGSREAVRAPGCCRQLFRGQLCADDEILVSCTSRSLVTAAACPGTCYASVSREGPGVGHCWGLALLCKEIVWLCWLCQGPCWSCREVRYMVLVQLGQVLCMVCPPTPWLEQGDATSTCATLPSSAPCFSSARNGNHRPSV